MPIGLTANALQETKCILSTYKIQYLPTTLKDSFFELILAKGLPVQTYATHSSLFEIILDPQLQFLGLLVDKAAALAEQPDSTQAETQ